MLDDIIAYDIAQSIRIPIHAAQDRLLPPWPGIASRLGAHPTGLALLISEQAFQEQACIRRNTLLPEQRTYPLLDLPKRRRPQRKRLLNRRCPRPRSSNHGCPLIQKLANNATVMLGLGSAAERWKYRGWRCVFNCRRGCRTGCAEAWARWRPAWFWPSQAWRHRPRRKPRVILGVVRAARLPRRTITSERTGLTLR